jgi:hypothetical protein
MCPSAWGAAGKKYAWQDHDTDVIYEDPPILNQWYTLFDDEDVRLLEMRVLQANDESAAKDIEVKWTIDGNVYFTTINANNNAPYFVFRNLNQSSGGTDGLASSLTENPAFIHDFKCGLSFKVELRIITAPGTSQILTSDAVHETLEET